MLFTDGLQYLAITESSQLRYFIGTSEVMNTSLSKAAPNISSRLPGFTGSKWWAASNENNKGPRAMHTSPLFCTDQAMLSI
jgi:hypothetical protein